MVGVRGRRDLISFRKVMVFLEKILMVSLFVIIFFLVKIRVS